MKPLIYGSPKNFHPEILSLSKRGFSLVELLVVMAIIAVVATFAVPAFTSITQGQGGTQAAYEISAAVEQARAEAVARQSYVWLGIEPITNDGNSNLAIGMVYSKDGTTDTTATNLTALRKTLILRGATLKKAGEMSVDGSLATLAELADKTSGIKFSIGGTKFQTGHTLTFTPEGEVMFKAAPNSLDGFDPRIGIGVRATKGATEITTNDVALVIDGGVALGNIYRKELQ